MSRRSDRRSLFGALAALAVAPAVAEAAPTLHLYAVGGGAPVLPTSGAELSAADLLVVRQSLRLEAIYAEQKATHHHCDPLSIEDYPDEALDTLDRLEAEEGPLLEALADSAPVALPAIRAKAHAVLLADFDSWGEGDQWRDMARSLCRDLLPDDPGLVRLDAAIEVRAAEEAER